MNWTQPICHGCFQQRYGFEPTRLKAPEKETCCVCGAETKDGIYVRLNPNIVKYPKE